MTWSRDGLATAEHSGYRRDARVSSRLGRPSVQGEQWSVEVRSPVPEHAPVARCRRMSARSNVAKMTSSSSALAFATTAPVSSAMNERPQKVVAPGRARSFPDPVLVHKMSVAPARSPDIRMEQLLDPQPLIDACLREHGIEGSIASTGTSYSEGPMDVGASIREMTWIDGS